jgi:hypothetical protein
LLGVIALAGLPLLATTAHAQANASKHGDLGSVAAKLSDPTSNVWALFTEFDLSFSDGDVNTGDPEIGSTMTFQPIMPIPLFGEGDKQWKLLTRPTIPVVFSSPVPEAFNKYDRKAGLGDITLPLMLSRPLGGWILGLGPTFLFPTATNDTFGREQFGIGPAGVVGYKTKKLSLGVFPQYYFKVGSIGNQADKPDANFMSLLYFAYWNLPDAWQIGFNPDIAYNNKATKGNRWNVPLGLTVAKTVSVGKMPVKFQLGLEYSVVSEDDFGKRFMLKLNIIPVISSLIEKPIFGGR